MKEACPRCGTENTLPAGTAPGTPLTCERCGYWWVPGNVLLSPEQARARAQRSPAPAEAGEVTMPFARPVTGSPTRLLSPVALAPRRPEPSPVTPAGPWDFELQFATGDAVQGPYDRQQLREMLYLGRLTGDERIRPPGTTAFERLSDRPEFAEVLILLGKEVGVAPVRHSIAGWRSKSEQEAAPEPPRAAPVPAAAPPVPAPATAPAAAPPPSSSIPWAMLGGGLLALAVAAGLLWYLVGSFGN